MAFGTSGASAPFFFRNTRMHVCTQGLPHETVTWWFPMPDFSRQIGLAVIVCLIDVLESISIAKALAQVNQYDLV